MLETLKFQEGLEGGESGGLEGVVGAEEDSVAVKGRGLQIRGYIGEGIGEVEIEMLADGVVQGCRRVVGQLHRARRIGVQDSSAFTQEIHIERTPQPRRKRIDIIDPAA